MLAKFGTVGSSAPGGLSPSRGCPEFQENTPFVKHLHLLRHAKSSWEDPDLVDHERPLAPRGERASLRIAEHVRREGIALELVLARRRFAPGRRSRPSSPWWRATR